jgi:hypothetical protein
MLDITFNNTKSNKVEQQCLGLQKYKGFQGTIKSLQVGNTPTVSSPQLKSDLCVATCGLDRFFRLHHVHTGGLVSKVFLKSRLNCLLFSKYEPVSAKKANDKKRSVEDDQLSEINSEDLGTDDLWSDMENVEDEFPELKRKLDKRMKEFDSGSDSDREDRPQRETDADHAFLKPRPVKAPKKAKKVK